MSERAATLPGVVGSTETVRVADITGTPLPPEAAECRARSAAGDDGDAAEGCSSTAVATGFDGDGVAKGTAGVCTATCGIVLGVGLIDDSCFSDGSSARAGGDALFAKSRGVRTGVTSITGLSTTGGVLATFVSSATAAGATVLAGAACAVATAVDVVAGSEVGGGAAWATARLVLLTAIFGSTASGADFSARTGVGEIAGCTPTTGVAPGGRRAGVAAAETGSISGAARGSAGDTKPSAFASRGESDTGKAEIPEPVLETGEIAPPEFVATIDSGVSAETLRSGMVAIVATAASCDTADTGSVCSGCVVAAVGEAVLVTIAVVAGAGFGRVLGVVGPVVVSPGLSAIGLVSALAASSASSGGVELAAGAAAAIFGFAAGSSVGVGGVLLTTLSAASICGFGTDGIDPVAWLAGLTTAACGFVTGKVAAVLAAPGSFGERAAVSVDADQSISGNAAAGSAVATASRLGRKDARADPVVSAAFAAGFVAPFASGSADDDELGSATAGAAPAIARSTTQAISDCRVSLLIAPVFVARWGRRGRAR